MTRARITRALVRKPAKNFADGITSASLGMPDYMQTLLQHAEYVKALSKAGAEPIVLPADPLFPDSCFVEDTAVILDQVAIITIPGHPSRQGEQVEIEKVLKNYLPVEHIEGQGRVDGGDILRVGNHFYIGRSDRTNEEGAHQLSLLLKKHGYTSSELPVEEGLHLKSGATALDEKTIIAIPEFKEFFPGYNIIDVGKDSYAANCLSVNGIIFMPMGFDRVKSKLQEAGFSIIELDMSEFRKMDGSLTCLSLLF